MATAKRAAAGAAKRGKKPADGLTTSMIIRISPDLVHRIDARVDELKAERPGISRSDFVREAIIRALREGGAA